MKKQQIQQLLTLIDTLEQARQECLRFMEAGNDNITINLLGDSQDTVLRMMEFIEQHQGGKSRTAAYLEELYKLYYQISSAILDGQKEEFDFDELKRLLEKVKTSIRDEWKPAPMKMLFLPYKASMWDSLESIWIAAKNDPECDAVVVPIPYFDKNPDGSLGKMHYEGGDFPSYVPVVHWQQYDLAENHPDVAFIHNPYDDRNTVTQVHNLYFSSNLKKYVKLLCYSPYFVTLKGISPHFAIMPAVLNSDLVIVESEEVRQDYLQVWADLVREKRVGENAFQIMERKILSLGSPKYDAVMRDCREDADIPEDWRRVIENSDGTRKKVVFYNTSVISLLKNTLSAEHEITSQYLDKLESVLRFFRQHKEVVVLWRPHPLMEQTFASMRPQLYQRYLRIVRDFRGEGEREGMAWGIFDDSPDLHRAIAVSDLYYGDPSSVVALFQAAGKPVLTQNVDILDDKKRLVVDKFYYDGEFLWCTAREFNGLFRINSKIFEIEYVGQFPGEKVEGYRLFYDIAEYNGKLYFSPYNAKSIAIYDKRTQSFSKISLKEKIRDVDGKFAGILIYGNYVYLQGNRVYTIVQIDTLTSEITYIEDWVEDIKQYVTGNSEFYIKQGCIHDGNLYYWSSGASGLLCIRPDDLSHSFIPLQCSDSKGFLQCLSDGRLIWLLRESGENSCIVYYDPHTLNITELVKINSSNSICMINENVYYFSISDPLFYQVNTKSKEIITFPLEKGIFLSAAVGNKIFMTTYMSGESYIFDTDNLNLEKEYLYLDDIQLPALSVLDMINENKKANQYARESGFLNLESLIDIKMADIEPRPSLSEGGCGNRIYEYVKGLIL